MSDDRFIHSHFFFNYIRAYTYTAHRLRLKWRENGTASIARSRLRCKTKHFYWTSQFTQKYVGIVLGQPESRMYLMDGAM